jgi:hypothetical protein
VRTLNLDQVLANLLAWCRARDFDGYDPFDGLNSRVFQATPLTNSRTARLFWTQFFKRSPVDFRQLAQVPPAKNAKGIALFSLAALSNYRRLQTSKAEQEARMLLDELVSMRLKGFSGAAWGYNFDWQGRAFFAPQGTPTIVPTASAVRALLEAAEVFDRSEYLQVARSACDFILNDLNRSEETRAEVCFSYSPLDRTRVFNASLLAGEVLATVGHATGETTLIDWAMRTASYVASRQRPDGSWPYGGDDYQSWADNFHTAFILTSLSRIIEASDTEPGSVSRGSVDQLDDSLRRGYDFWRERFFLSNGWPKYFPDRLYPADAHSVAAAIVALLELHHRAPTALVLADQFLKWALDNLLSPEGYFYYQRRRFYTVRIPYMRWSEAWMAYALARLVEVKSK